MGQQKANPLFLLLEWAGAEKYKLYFSILCALLGGLMVIVPYMVIYHIIEDIYLKILTENKMIQYGIIIMASVVLRYLLVGVGVIFSHKGAYNALYRVRSMIVNHMAKIPLGSLSERHTGEIKKVISEDIEKLELFLAHHLVELVLYAAGPIGIFLYLCTVDWRLALLSLFPIPIAIYLQHRMFRGYDKQMQEMNQVMSALNSVMIEYISGMKLIKAYNMGVDSYQKYAQAIDEHQTLWKKLAQQMGPLFAAFVIVLQCGVVVLVPMCGFWFIHGQGGAGTFILFTFVGSLYLLELRPLLEMGSSLSQVLNGISNAKTILDIPAFTEGRGTFPQKQDITLQNVSFSYNGKDTILKNVNVYIPSGEKIAFVGKSGAGKSTLIQLIARFYDVSSGEILIGGCNIKDIAYETLLKNIGIVFQNTFLTRQSVLENIKMGTEATLVEVQAAAKKAQIHDFIESLPEGYQTKVGSYGSRFSGGEKQRIAIARAILKNAPLLILDEATSAADPENRREIHQAIDELCADKTVIVIAHRLDTVKKCDRIAVVEENTVTAIGTHEELLKINQYYQRVWEDYEKSQNISYGLNKGVQA